jgi:hypothetical protein
MAKQIWQLILSYDADSSLYKLEHSNVDFNLIVKEEGYNFRVGLLILLLESGANEIQSHVASTVLYKITLGEDKGPRKYFMNVFNDVLGKDFRYTIGTLRVTTKDFGYHSMNTKQTHLDNFKVDLALAENLRKKHTKLSK